MVASCCAYGCTAKAIKGGPITFHSFPKDETRRRLWEIKLKRKNFKASDSTRICSKHFTEDCFEREKFGGTWLTKDAVPTIFNFPPHLRSEDNERKASEIRISLKRENSLKERSMDMESFSKRKRCYYLGDFDESDMQSPTLAVQALQRCKQEKIEMNKKMRALNRQTRKLQKQVATLQHVLSEIRKTSLITYATSYELKMASSPSKKGKVEDTNHKEKCFMCQKAPSARNGSFARELNCHHPVHSKCLRSWHKRLCPICLLYRNRDLSSTDTDENIARKLYASVNRTIDGPSSNNEVSPRIIECNVVMNQAFARTIYESLDSDVEHSDDNEDGHKVNENPYLSGQTIAYILPDDPPALDKIKIKDEPPS